MANLPPESDGSSTGIDSLPVTELIVRPLDHGVQDKPSAHPVALAAEDILREIFWCFDTSVHTIGSRATLLHAALTCKAFMEPALDALWWSMSSMMPALKLLPNLRTVTDTSNIFIRRSCLLRVDSVDLWFTSQTFSGGLSASGWARFDYHAKRVREFHHHSASDEEMATTALFHFSWYRPAIFPRLQKIVWTTSLSPSIMLLTSPTLNSLDIRAVENDDPSVMTTLLLVFGDSPQSLTEVALRGSIAGTCLALVPKMAFLSTVIIPDLGASVSTTFLRQLGTMERLENLHISLQRPSTEPFPLPGQIGFPALRTIRVSGRFELIYNFIVAVVSKQVASLLVSSDCKIPEPQSARSKKKKPAPAPEQPSHFSDLLLSITARWPLLSRLDFDLPNMSPKYPDTTSYALLEPIHNCPLLESISIRGFSRVPSSDQDLVDIGSCLPNARVLAIPFSPPPTIDPAGDTNTACPRSTPTILGLRLLTELCPGLTSLQLSIDTREMPILTGEPLIHGLQTLFVGDSPVGDAFLVAKHLDCLFPYLNKISGSNPITIPTTTHSQWGHVETTMVMTDSVREGWELVEKIIHSCQAARADEHKRTWMRGGRANPVRTRAARVLINHS